MLSNYYTIQLWDLPRPELYCDIKFKSLLGTFNWLWNKFNTDASHWCLGKWDHSRGHWSLLSCLLQCLAQSAQSAEICFTAHRPEEMICCLQEWSIHCYLFGFSFCSLQLKARGYFSLDEFGHLCLWPNCVVLITDMFISLTSKQYAVLRIENVGISCFWWFFFCFWLHVPG